MHDELHLVTMDEYRSLTHRYFDPSYRQRLQWAARKLAKDRGITLEKQFREFPRNGQLIPTYVNVYPRSSTPSNQRKGRSEKCSNSP